MKSSYSNPAASGGGHGFTCVVWVICCASSLILCAYFSKKERKASPRGISVILRNVDNPSWSGLDNISQRDFVTDLFLSVFHIMVHNISLQSVSGKHYNYSNSWTYKIRYNGWKYYYEMQYFSVEKTDSQRGFIFEILSQR